MIFEYNFISSNASVLINQTGLGLNTIYQMHKYASEETSMEYFENAFTYTHHADVDGEAIKIENF